MEPIKTIETVFWDCIIFHCTDKKHKTDHSSTFLRFHIIQLEELVPETIAKRSFLCYLLGTGKVRGGVNWWIVRATKGPLWLHKRHREDRYMVQVLELRQD